MKRNLILFALTLLLNLVLVGKANAQAWFDLVSWSFSVEKIDDNHANVIAKAKLVDGWHIFSVDHDPMKADLTGYPTTFKFKESSNYKLIGKLKDGKTPGTHVDDMGTSL
jgi:hypothetical protein